MSSSRNRSWSEHAETVQSLINMKMTDSDAFHGSFEVREALQKRIKKLEATSPNEPAHPDSISAALYSLPKPSRPEDLEAAQLMLALAKSGTSAPNVVEAVDTRVATKHASPSAKSEAASRSSNDEDATESDSDPVDPKGKAPASSKKQARTRHAPRAPKEPTARPTITSSTTASIVVHRSSYTGRPLVGASAIVGESLDDLIETADTHWRGVLRAHQVPKAESAKAVKKAKEVAAPKKRKAPAVEEEKEAEPLTTGTGNNQDVPVGKKRKTGGAKAKGPKKPTIDPSPLRQSTTAENSDDVAVAAPVEEERGGRPKRIRRSPAYRRSF